MIRLFPFGERAAANKQEGLRERSMWPNAIALAALLVASCGEPAGAQESRQWIGATSPDSVSLLYGTPDTDDVVINFTCDRVKKSIRFAYTFEPAGATSGMRIDVELSSEGGKMVLNAAGRRMDTDDAFVLEATTRADAALRRTLTEGRTLSIRVQMQVQAFPLSRATKPAADLIAACR
jgi:hypothetical protein